MTMRLGGVLAVLSPVAAPAAWADFDAGQAAFDAGRIEAAAAEWRAAHAAGAAREGFEASAFGAFSPAIEGGKGNADRCRRRAGVLAGLLPAFEGVLLV